jgi:hypothetical protein
VHVIRRTLFVVAFVVSCTAGLVVPTTTATAAANGSGLSQCEKNAAERYARRLESGGDKARAKRQFNNDIARCKRKFG